MGIRGLRGWVYGVGFRVSGFGIRVEGLGFRVQSCVHLHLGPSGRGEAALA